MAAAAGITSELGAGAGSRYTPGHPWPRRASLAGEGWLTYICHYHLRVIVKYIYPNKGVFIKESSIIYLYFF